MKFVCAFAWSDLSVQKGERAFIAKLVRQLELTDDEQEQVEQWLAIPPRAEEVDPEDVPQAHRRLFLDAARATVVADGHIDMEEAENLALLEMILKP
ncbi:MAG: TerB family tellurite resistance protein [Myxococcales bacterium]|nr:TerB family tellurite resistance protein [Myxococcales bacterium]